MMELVIYKCEAGLDELLHQLNITKACSLLVNVLPTITEFRGRTPENSCVVEVTKAVLRFDSYLEYKKFAPRLSLTELTSKEYYR